MELKKVLIVDVETTGVTEGLDQIIQIAILKPGKNPVWFTSYIRPREWPNIEYSDKVAEITGISREQIDNFPDEEEVMENLCKWLSEHASGGWHTLIAYNAEFDYRMIKTWFKKWGIMKKWREHFLMSYFDLYAYFNIVKNSRDWPGRISLEKIAQYLKISTEDLQLHDAKSDVKLLWRIIIKLQQSNKLNF